MHELISPRAVEKALMFLAVAGPLVGLIVGCYLGAHARRSWPTVVSGLMIGCLGPLIYGMWEVYGVITDRLGLDSVVNLVLQLLVFAVLGAALGIAVYRMSLFLKRLSTE
jgi:hypothetical protein